MQSIESINTTRRFILRILANKKIHMNETNEMKKIKPIHKRINGSSMNILMAATYTRKIIIIVIISSTTTITTTSTTKQYIYSISQICYYQFCLFYFFLFIFDSFFLSVGLSITPRKHIALYSDS